MVSMGGDQKEIIKTDSQRSIYISGMPGMSNTALMRLLAFNAADIKKMVFLPLF